MSVSLPPPPSSNPGVLFQLCELLHVPGDEVAGKNFHAVADLDTSAFVALAIEALPAVRPAHLRRLELLLHGLLVLEPAYCVLLGACRLERKKYEAAHRAFCAALHDLGPEETALRQHAQLGRARTTLKLGRPFWATVDLQSAQRGPDDRLSRAAKQLLKTTGSSLRLTPLQPAAAPAAPVRRLKLPPAPHRRPSSVAAVQVSTVA